MKKFLAIFFSLIMLLTAAAVPGLGEQELTEEELAALEQLLEEDADDNLYGSYSRVEIDHNDLSVNPDLDPAWMNILLLGVDTKDNTRFGGRTDAMLVLSVNANTGEAKLSSIVRDLYILIPNGIGYNRINTAYAFGGPYFAMKVVNESLGLNITRFCAIDFRRFEEVVDVLGGVEIEVSAGEARLIGKYTDVPTHAGLEKLNGKQALIYCRLREADNNFKRNERQRKFLTALLKKVMSENDLSQMLNVAEKVLRSMDTNLTLGDLVMLVADVLPKLETLEAYSLPEEGDYDYHTTAEGAAVVLAKDLTAVGKKLQAFIYGN